MFFLVTVMACAACAEPPRPDGDQEVQTMSSAALMPEASSLAGAWRLHGPAGDCGISLLEADRPLASGSLAAPMLAADLACEGLENVVGWRPVPLGLALTDAEGRSVATFERTGASQYTSIDQVWRLTRD